MKVIILTLSLLMTVYGSTDVEQWENFKIEHNKRYANQKEENFRFTIFKGNLQKIRENNEKFEKGETTFKLGVNQFADMTVEEFGKFLGFQQHLKPTLNKEKGYFVSESSTMPKSVNWTDAGAVTIVKDQGSCGSCWSFSAVGSLEGQYFRKTGKLVSFSAQNLVDCDSTCAGCNGGLMDRAFEYIEKNGIDTDQDYPYRGRDEPCEAKNKSAKFIEISSYGYVKENSEEELQKAVAAIGPISVAIEASDVFQLYASGILNDKTCGNTVYDLNHGVLAVGYGTENGKDFWIVKNSWGSTWGENGYIRMSRNVNNQCGIATEPVYPIM